MYVENKEKKYYVYMYTSPSGKHYVGQWCNVGEEDTIGKYRTKEKQAMQIVQFKDGEAINIFSSINEANRFLSKEGSSIIKCLRGELKHAYGFEWKYLKDIDKTLLENFSFSKNITDKVGG